MHLVIIIPFYRRFQVTDAIFRHYKRMQKTIRGTKISILAVGSEGRVSRAFARAAGVDYVEGKNLPLDEKFEFGFVQSRAYNADAVCLVGSNDVITAGYFEKALVAIAENTADSTGLLDCFLVDEATRRILYWPGYRQDSLGTYESGVKSRFGESLGAGRIFSRTILDRMHWRPYRTNTRELRIQIHDDENNLDCLQEHGARIINWKMTEVPCEFWNIKTETDLNPLSAFEAAYGEDLMDVTLEKQSFWDTIVLSSDNNQGRTAISAL